MPKVDDLTRFSPLFYTARKMTIWADLEQLWKKPSKPNSTPQGLT
jgi:hypothetical protein